MMIPEQPTAGHGILDAFGDTADWTEQDWADYDAFLAAQIDEWDDQQDDYIDLDPEPPF